MISHHCGDASCSGAHTFSVLARCPGGSAEGFDAAPEVTREPIPVPEFAQTKLKMSDTAELRVRLDVVLDEGDRTILRSRLTGVRRFTQEGLADPAQREAITAMVTRSIMAVFDQHAGEEAEAKRRSGALGEEFLTAMIDGLQGRRPKDAYPLCSSEDECEAPGRCTYNHNSTL
jgi:hypothetical protein